MPKQTAADKAAYQRRWRAANREHVLEYGRARRKANPEKARAALRDWYRRNPGKNAENCRRQALKRFGLSIPDYDALLEAQGGTCALCDRECPTGRRLAVDHDHATGRVRGLLCYSCNTKLGFFDLHRERILDYVAEPVA